MRIAWIHRDQTLSHDCKRPLTERTICPEIKSRNRLFGIIRRRLLVGRLTLAFGIINAINPREWGVNRRSPDPPTCLKSFHVFEIISRSAHPLRSTVDIGRWQGSWIFALLCQALIREKGKIESRFISREDIGAEESLREGSDAPFPVRVAPLNKLLQPLSTPPRYHRSHPSLSLHSYSQFHIDTFHSIRAFVRYLSEF